MATYDKNTDYQALINSAVQSGNLGAAAQYEQQRNAKIAGEGIADYQATSNYASYLPSASGGTGASGDAAPGYAAYTGGNSSLDDQLKAYSAAYAASRAAGDVTGMRNANDAANQLRNQYGYAAEVANTDIAAMAAQQAAYSGTAYQTGTSQYPAYTAYGSYTDFYNQNGYGSLTAAQRAAADAYVQQAVNSINTQKQTVNDSADEMARQAYISYMQSREALPQRLGAAGYSGGMADSHQLALETGLQNNQNSIERDRAKTLTGLDSAITDARLQGEIQLAQQDAQAAQAAIQAWNSYVTGQNQLASSDYWNQKGYDYQAGRDAVSDQWAQTNYDYQLSRDAAGDTQRAGDTAGTNAWALIQMGIMPDAGLLQAAGISSQDAQAYVAEVQRQRALQEAGSASAYSGGSAAAAMGGTQDAVTKAVESFNAGDYSEGVISTLIAGGYTMDQLTAAGYPGQGGTVNSYAQLGTTAQSIASNLAKGYGTAAQKAALIEKALSAGTITQAEAGYLLTTVGY